MKSWLLTLPSFETAFYDWILDCRQTCCGATPFHWLKLCSLERPRYDILHHILLFTQLIMIWHQPLDWVRTAKWTLVRLQSLKRKTMGRGGVVASPRRVERQQELSSVMLRTGVWRLYLWWWSSLRLYNELDLRSHYITLEFGITIILYMLYTYLLTE